MNRDLLSRRSLLKNAAGSAGAAVAVAQGFSSAFAQDASPAAAPPSGTITVSYPDQAGLKPKYVTQAAESLQSANAGTTINIDLENVGDDDYYTKLLLALDSGNGPDVFHIGGNSAGELADAGYIEPLDAYLAEWPDWAQFYPRRSKPASSTRDRPGASRTGSTRASSTTARTSSESGLAGRLAAGERRGHSRLPRSRSSKTSLTCSPMRCTAARPVPAVRRTMPSSRWSGHTAAR